MVDSLFANRKKNQFNVSFTSRKKKRRDKQPKDIFSFTRWTGFVALGVTFFYLFFIRSESNVWIARILLVTVLLLNVFYDRLVYRREMRRRESQKG